MFATAVMSGQPERCGMLLMDIGIRLFTPEHRDKELDTIAV
jgi:hypothetical protein